MITRTTCRVCEGHLETVLSLGEQYVSNFLSPGEPDGVKAPLELTLCQKCTLLQLRHTVPANALYQNYWYRSGTNQTMRDALANIAGTAEELISLRPGDTVLDIGCNDGTLLGSYKTENITKIGFDPASNLTQFSRKIANWVVDDFFTAEKYLGTFHLPKIITSIAMFYDLEDPNKFVADIKQVMHPNGIWVLQMSYLPLMLSQHDFGNICHEHLEYYSLKSLEYLLDRHDMIISDVQINEVNGGSIRAFIRNRGAVKLGDYGYQDDSRCRVEALIHHENELRLDDPETYTEFDTWIKRIKADVYDFIWQQVYKGKKTAVYGASTKGNVMLQYMGLGSGAINAAADRNPDKWGLETVGTRIPIISEEEARAMKPDYMLVLPWHFMEEFREREKKYLFEGGKFIVPLPHFTLV